MHADRTNRTLLIVLALLLLAVGLGGSRIHRRVRHRHPDQHADGQSDRALLRRARCLAVARRRGGRADRSGDLLIKSSTGAGRTTLANRALTGAVVGEMEGYRGVDSAQARLIGDPDDPELVVRAVLEETADFTALRQRIETEALTHARQALGNMSLPTQLDLTITSRRSARVV
jgi:hypothetical protein